jgi:hypothetical protein
VGDALPPLYISRWPQSALQPIVCQHVNGYLFVLRGVHQNLQNLIDRFLNTPAAGSRWSYRALTDLVVLTFDRTEKLVPQNPPGNNLGSTPESEASLWIPVLVMREELGIQIPDHFAFYVPYIFVEEWLAIMGGREVYGFPKEQAWLEVPSDPTAATHLSADVVGAPDFGPDVQFARVRLVDVNRQDGAATQPLGSNLGELLGFLEQELRENLFIPTPNLVADLIRDLAEKQFTLVFLKQFFDASDGLRTCYQAIIEAPVRLTRDPLLQRMSDDFQVTWQSLATHPIQQDLGLPAQQIALRTYTADFDFVIENGTTVWSPP